MSSTPAQRFVCPRCRASFAQPSHYCRECGADMTRASALEAAVVRESSEDGSASPSSTIDRRLSDSNQAWLGKIVDGRYRVIEVIGRGGMGVVYRVEHLRMGKLAAMKVLHRDLAQDPDVIARFEREAAAVSKLHHPHTVQVFDFGTTQGSMYLIMELVRGQDLARIVERDGPLPWARAAPLFAQICGALQEAHELGIVHRDLKPENVLITRSTAGRDYAKVLDFGLAKLEQPRDAPKRETERQAIVGTPYFMAPEQIRGDHVDARTDIYSFGALVFEVLTGQHLYSGSTAVGVLTKHLTADPDAPSNRAPEMGIPPAVDHLCRKALAREPDERWQSAAALGEAIEEIYAETVTETTGQRQLRGGDGGRLVFVESVTDSDPRLRRADIDAYEASLRRRRWSMTSVLVLSMLGGAAAVAWYALRPAPPLTEESEPNNDAATANVIAAGAPVTGYLGKRRSITDGDRDLFRVPFPSGEHRIVSLQVTGLPNIDLHLGIADHAGLHAVTVDEHGIGGGEVMHRRAVDGPILVTVGETRTPDAKLPVENVSDAYTLTVVEEPAAGGESEPNGIEADANPLVLGEQLRGYLDTRDDVDLLRWTGGDGTFNITVHVDGLDVVWSVGDGAQRTAGLARVELHRGDIIRVQRKGVPTRPDATWAIVVTPS